MYAIDRSLGSGLLHLPVPVRLWEVGEVGFGEVEVQTDARNNPEGLIQRPRFTSVQDGELWSYKYAALSC